VATEFPQPSTIELTTTMNELSVNQSCRIHGGFDPLGPEPFLPGNSEQALARLIEQILNALKGVQRLLA
jgi:hypothetical protein